jgi:hypothetical protein
MAKPYPGNSDFASPTEVAIRLAIEPVGTQIDGVSARILLIRSNGKFPVLNVKRSAKKQ